MKYLALALLAGLVAGCANTQELAQRDHKECASLGFTPGTDAFGNCQLQVRSIRAQEAGAAAARTQAAIAAGNSTRNAVMNPYQ